MAYSVNTYTGDGTTTQFAVNFTLGYLSQLHVFCAVEGEVDGQGDPIYRTLTWITDSLVDIGTAPALGLGIKVRRITPKNVLMHDFQDGAVMNESNFDESHLQNLMIAHELLDGFGQDDASRQENLDMLTYKVINLGDPTQPQDAVTKEYTDSTIPAMVTETEGYRDEAQTARTGAETAEINAQLRAWEAEAEKMTADSYATEPEDTLVKTWASAGDGTFTSANTTEYSALHWAAKADAIVTNGVITEYLTTAETSTWTVPSDVTDIQVIAAGAGAGAGGSGHTSYRGGDGGDGGTKLQIIPVTPSSVLNYRVGTGGTGGTTTPTDGTDGQSSYFDSLISPGGSKGLLASFSDGADGADGNANALLTEYGAGGIGSLGISVGTDGTDGVIILQYHRNV